MTSCSISEAADRTGFSASTLRFYEQCGLIRPGRTAAGHRRYDEDDLDVLGFVARAKGLGLALEDIAGLVALYRSEDCASVQEELSATLAAEHDRATERLATLSSFVAELRRVRSHLDQHRRGGTCAPACGCGARPRTDPDREETRPIGSSVDTAWRTAVDLGCTLPADAHPDRREAWRAVAVAARTTQEIRGGWRLVLEPATDPVDLVELIVAERSCCGFLSFELRLGPEETVLDVTGPPEAAAVLAGLVGAP